MKESLRTFLLQDSNCSIQKLLYLCSKQVHLKLAAELGSVIHVVLALETRKIQD